MNKVASKPYAKGRNQEQIDILRRVYGNMPVRDAAASLIVTVEDVDAVDAVRTNAENCVFSKACHRIFHSSKAVFFRATVYLDLPDEDGERSLVRFLAGTRMRNAIKEYDKTGNFKPGIYVLGAVPRSRTLDTQLRRTRAHSKKMSPEKKREHNKKNEARKKAIKMKARAVKTIAVAAEARGFVRNGSGLIQTIIDTNGGTAQ